MFSTRREFLDLAVLGGAATSLAATSGAVGQIHTAATSDVQTFTLVPIGRVEKQEETVRIRIFDDYADGLLGLEDWSHVNVFYWFDRNDTPQRRRVLQVHPRGDKRNPLTGVFACRAPVRPNLIALSVCKIVSVQQSVVTVDALDAFDGTPVLDLKPFIPPDAPRRDLRVPAWAGPRRSAAP